MAPSEQEPPTPAPWSFDEVPRPAASIPTAWGSILDPSLQFLHPLPAEAAAYWRSKVLAGRLPTRADIDPLEIRSLLANVLMFDCAGPRYRFRLMGTAMSGFFGELTGRWLDEVLPEPSLIRYTTILREVATRRAGMREIGRMLFRSRSWQIGEIFAAPLVDDDGAVAIIFAVMAIWSENAVPPEVLQACRVRPQST